MHQIKNHPCDHCKGTVQPGKYCPECGLHNIGKSTGFWDFMREGIEQVISVENGFILGIKNSLTSPRSLVLDYYYGYRNHSPSPGKMVLYTLLALGFIYLVFGETGFFDVTISGVKKDEFNGIKIFMIILIPYIVFSSKLLYWKKFRGIVIHMMSIAFLFLPRFVILVAVCSFLGYMTNEPSLYLNIGLILTLFWFFYMNAVVMGVSGILKKVLFAVLHFVLFISLMLFTIAVLLLSSYADVQFN